MKKIIVGLLFLLYTSGFCGADPLINGCKPGEWTMDLAAARAESQKSSLPILVKFTRTGYTDSRNESMEAQVFAKPEWQKWAAANLNLVVIDFPADYAVVPAKYRQSNWDLMKYYNITDFPSYLLLECDGSMELARFDFTLNVCRDFINAVRSVLPGTQRSAQVLAQQMPDDQVQAYLEAVKALNANRKAIADWRSRKPVDKIAEFAGEIRQIEALFYISLLAGEGKANYEKARLRANEEQQALNDWKRTADTNSPDYSTTLAAKEKSLSDQTQIRIDEILKVKMGF